jgi:CRP-like cAMP-binding protein
LQLSPKPGKHVEVAIVGREGFGGVSILAGEECAHLSAVSISAGEAYVIPREIFHRYLGMPAFCAAVDRYRRLFITSLCHTLVCNRVHVIEETCIGRLLLIHDRIPLQSLLLTQEVFASQLGVRRATVSRVLSGLQKLGAVSYDRRGRMTIVDRQCLERLACPCYHAIKAAFDRLVDQQGGL